MRPEVDLNSHVNRSFTYGGLDFPIEKRTVAYLEPKPELGSVGNYVKVIPNRTAIVRSDTGECLSVMSNRYKLIEHKDLLETVEGAITGLGLGDVPRGIYAHSRGRTMRALYKFPSLEQDVSGTKHCPMVRLANTYDGTGRIACGIGAFTFVCTNFSIGGSGAFASGFFSLHVGNIDVPEIGRRLREYLEKFDEIMATFRKWSVLGFREFEPHVAAEFNDGLPRYLRERIFETKAWMYPGSYTVYDAYAATTEVLTHSTRTATVAFRSLDKASETFQKVLARKAA